MSRTNIFSYVLFLVFTIEFLVHQPVLSQGINCTNQLENAQNYFNEGKYNLIPSYLDDCFSGGFTVAEMITAYRLITITNLYLDKLDEADSVYTLLLEIDPERKPDPAVDPPDLIFLHNNFRTSPVFSTKFFGGVNYTLPDMIYDATIFAENERNESYTGVVGGNIGVGAELNIIPQFSVGGEVGASIRNILHTDVFLSHEDGSNEWHHNLRFTENQFWLDVPVYIKYTFEKNKNRPYVFGGFIWNLLFYTQASGYEKNYNVKEGDKDFVTPFTAPDINLMDHRNYFNYGLVFGAGMLIKLKGIDYLLMEIRYNPGFTNVNLPEKRFENDIDLIKYSSAGDDFRINTISLNIGLFMPQYRPKKISDNTEL